MKKILSIAVSAAGLFALSSCGTQGNALTESLLSKPSEKNKSVSTPTTVKTGTSILDNLLSSVLSHAAISPKELIGTWQYKGVDAVFESESLLAQAGGTVMAAQLENQIDEKIAKFGIKKGITTFTFRNDKTFSATLNGKSFSGTYQLDAANKVLVLSTMGGLFTLRPHVVRTTGGISLLFQADKMLTLLNTTSALIGQTGALGSLGNLTSLLNNYNGLRLGLQLKK